MPAPFEVELIAPESIVFSGPAVELSVDGIAGSLGILANHAPLLTELKIGEAALTEPGGQRRHFYIGGGFLEVNRNQVTILAEEAFADDEMDPVEAERQQVEAQQHRDAATTEQDRAAAEIELQRARARASVARRPR